MLYKHSVERLADTIKNTSGHIGLAFSHQIEDVIAIHLLFQAKISLSKLEFFTLDTHKLFKESLEYQKKVEKFFHISIVSYKISGDWLSYVDTEIGEWGMRESLQKRKQCCEIRKIIPLKEALSNKTAWISGIRATQSITRANVKLVEEDIHFGLNKINPLYDWSDEAVWAYAKLHNLPINALYHQGFKSIGCSPCTRPIKEGEDTRAGRWWWEDPNHKECGLHQK